MVAPLRPVEQSTAYAMLAPLAMLALVIWLPNEQFVALCGAAFVVVGAGLLWLFPRDLQITGYAASRWWMATLVVLAAIGATTRWWQPGLIMALLALWLLRLWYIRQYHLKRGSRDKVELLRRCLLLALWTHLSVLAASLSPYLADY